MKVSEFVAEYLVKNGIKNCFSVTGGFAMHFNDAFGQTMNVMYTHGESPAGYAAIGYSSVNYEPSVCCVTSGCGATNAVTPCMIAYQDSVPVFFISGQVHSTDNIRKFASKGQTIRGYFGSDVDIIKMVYSITKFSHEVWDPSEIKKVLDRCLYNLTTGRLGPVWLSIPVDVQAMQIPERLETWYPSTPRDVHIPPEFFDMWKGAKRPLILAGNGIHISGTESRFRKFLIEQRVPYVVSFFGIDLGDDETGRVGLIGNRSGNFAVQNCDVLLCLGCRLSKSITGYNRDMFAPKCSVIYIDIDQNEFIREKKTSLNICCDLKTFFDTSVPVCEKMDPEWLVRTKQWRDTWSYELPSTKSDNPYPITKHFFETKPPGCVSVASSGSLYCVVWHMFKCKEGDRFISSGHGDMGYEVPAAIGASLHGKQVYAFVGDGSFQLNLQELQTIKTYNLPVVIMYYNNSGYGAIQITQNAIFKREFGTTPKSGLECPDIKKIAQAYGIPCYDSRNADYASIKGPAIVEVVCTVQERTPKLSNKPGPDGKFINLPYQDMAPFLDRDFLEANMY
jgi:acetolactate synthase-1/2/3 large subunit